MVETKENAFNRRGDEKTRRQGETNPVSTNPVGANALDLSNLGRPATEDTPPQLSPTSELQTPPPTPQPPIPEDDDEEVSWQNAARASLEKEKNAKSRELRAESSVPSDRVEPKAESQTVKQQATISPSPPFSLSTYSPKLETFAPEPPPPTEQFTREELPADFWGSESEPPPASSYDDDEAFDTATSAPSGNGQGGKTRGPSKPNAKLPFDMPLFNELQALFPGRIVRIDMKQQKQAEESEEGTEPSNEAANVVESDESE
jgi:hypothetical protein